MLILEMDFSIPDLTLMIDSYILVFFEYILSTQSSFEHMGQPSVYSPVFTVCHKVISLVYSLFQYLIGDCIQ